MSLDLEVFPTGEWAMAVAARLGEALGVEQSTRVCLATGDTTRPVYQNALVNGAPEVFLLDEFGGLPEDDPARCAVMLRGDLPGVWFHAPDVDAADPDLAATEYGKLITGDVLDLAVVGLGRNGHVGMNEPGSSRQSRTRVVRLHETTTDGALTYGASTRPSWGITVGMYELLRARELWLLVTGGHKAGMLDRVMRGPIGPEIPASFLREHHNAVVLADTAAAGDG